MKCPFTLFIACEHLSVRNNVIVVAAVLSYLQMKADRKKNSIDELAEMLIHKSF